MSTATDNASMDTNKKAGVDNPDTTRLKKGVKSTSQTSQDCPNYTPLGHGPPSKDIGTLYYDCKLENR